MDTAVLEPGIINATHNLNPIRCLVWALFGHHLAFWHYPTTFGRPLSTCNVLIQPHIILSARWSNLLVYLYQARIYLVIYNGITGYILAWYMCSADISCDIVIYHSSQSFGSTPTTCSRWYDYEWLKADYNPDSSIHPSIHPSVQQYFVGSDGSGAACIATFCVGGVWMVQGEAREEAQGLRNKETQGICKTSGKHKWGGLLMSLCFTN